MKKMTRGRTGYRIDPEKEKTIKTLLDSINKNRKFKRLLIFSLNALDLHTSEKNADYKLNCKTIIKLDGISIFKDISILNMKDQEIVKRISDLLYRLMSYHGEPDSELTNLFVEKGGDDAAIELLLSNDPTKENLSLVKILNGLVRVPKIADKMLDGCLIQAVKLANDLYINDPKIMALNLDTIKKISNTKRGREELIKKDLIPNLIKTVKKMSDQGNQSAIINGMSILNNLLKSEEGKEAFKDKNTTQILSEILTKYDEDKQVISLGAKIMKKISNQNDAKSNILQIVENTQQFEPETANVAVVKNLAKSAKYTSNLMLIEDVAKGTANDESLNQLKDCLLKINKIPLEGKTEDFLKYYVQICQSFTTIFSKLFEQRPECLDKSTEKGKEFYELLCVLRDLFKKVYVAAEAKKQEIQQSLSKPEAAKIVDNMNVYLRDYFGSYDDILIQEYNSQKKDEQIDENLVNTLEYLNSNVIKNGAVIFHTDERSTLAATKLLKLSTEISEKQPEKSENLCDSIYECFPYVSGVSKISQNPNTLKNIFSILHFMINGEPSEKKEKIKDELLPISVQFLSNKSCFREANAECLSALNQCLSPELIAKMNDPKEVEKNPNLKLDFIGVTVNSMSKEIKPNQKEDIQTEDDEDEVDIYKEKYNKKAEEQIKKEGVQILSKLVTKETFEKDIKNLQSKSKSYAPANSKSEQYDSLLESINFQSCLINKKENLDAFIEHNQNELPVSDLVKKEITFIEDYKKKNTLNENNKEKYEDTLQKSSNRINDYQIYAQNLLTNFQKQYEETKDPKYLNNFCKIFNSQCFLLEKSTDYEAVAKEIENMRPLFKFINKYQEDITKADPKNADLNNKMVTSTVKAFRNNAEEAKVVNECIKSFISFGIQDPTINNTIVKEGCSRLLLTSMKNTSKPEIVASALNLLIQITDSSNDNLVMVANQDAATELFEIRSKYATDNNIGSKCDKIINEIMKLPGQEDKAIKSIKTSVKELNELCKKSDKEGVKEEILQKIEVINAFTSNKKIIEETITGKECFDDLVKIVDESNKDQDISAMNENLVSNGGELLKKIKDSIKGDSEEEKEMKKIIAEKIIDQFINKPNYKGVVESTSKSLEEMINDDDLYESYLKDKIDTKFIDKLLEIKENYEDNPNISKSLNSTLCTICQKNSELGNYIIEKGGMKSVIDDLKVTVGLNDKEAIEEKEKGLNILISVMNTPENFKKFDEANGCELIDAILENEVKQIKKDQSDKPQSDYNLAKINGIDLRTDEMKKNEEIISETKVSKTEKSVAKSIALSAKIMKKGMEQGKTEYFDEKKVENLICLLEAFKDDKEIFNDISNLIANEAVVLPDNVEVNKKLLNIALDTRAKNYADEEVKENCQKIIDKVSPKVFQNENVKNEIQSTIQSVLNMPNSPEQKEELQKICSFITLGLANKEFNSAVDAESKILPIYTKAIQVFQPNENGEIPKELTPGTALCLLKMTNHLADKGLINEQDPDVIDKAINVVLPFYLPDNYHYCKEVNNELDKFYDKVGKVDKTKEQKEGSPIFTPQYNNLLIKSFPNNAVFVKNYHKDLSTSAKGTYPDLNANTEENLDKALERLTDFYNMESGGEELKGNNLIGTVSDTVDIIRDLDDNGIYKKETPNNEITKKLNQRAQKLWKITNKAIEDDDGNVLNSDEGAMLNAIIAVEKTKKLEINSPELGNVILKVSEKAPNNETISKKVLDYAKADLSANKDNEEIKKQSVAMIANVSKHPEALKEIVNDKDLMKQLIEEYNNHQTADSYRSSLTEIFANMTKNKIYAEQLVNDNSDLIKNITENALKTDPSKKEEAELSKKEMEIIADILKDSKTLKMAQDSNSISDDNLMSLRSKVIDNKIECDLDKVIDQILEKNVSKQEEMKIKNDQKTIKELSTYIEQALEDHKKCLNEKSAVIDEEDELNETGQNKKPTQMRSRHSFVTDTLLYNPNNVDIKSTLSSKSNSEMPNVLTKVVSTLSKIIDDYNNAEDHDMKVKREPLLKECLKCLKSLCVSSDNHKPIVENGLIECSGKMTEKKEEEQIPVEIQAKLKEVLYYCTLSEAASEKVIDSPLLEQILDEINKMYDNEEETMADDQKKKLFENDNKIFSNLCKSQKGSETLLKKIKLEDLLKIGEKTHDSSLLGEILASLNNYIKSIKQLQNEKTEDSDVEEKKQAITAKFCKPIVQLCKKALNVEDKTSNLESKVLNLVTMLYNSDVADLLDSLSTISHINEDFDSFSKDKGYIHSSIKCLTKICDQNVRNSNETVSSKLIVKFKDKVQKLKRSESQEILMNLTELYMSLINNNPENIEQFCKMGLTENILFFLKMYSKRMFKMKGENEEEDKLNKQASKGTMNAKVLGVSGQVDDASLNQRLTTSNFNPEKILYTIASGNIGTSYVQTLSNSMILKEKSNENNMIIVNNLIKLVEVLTGSPSTCQYLGKTNFAEFMIELLKNYVLDYSFIAQCLHTFGNYLYDVKSNAKNLNLETLYQLLKSLQVEYYSNSLILISLNFIIGSIIKNIDDKDFIKKFFLLISDNVKCQDYNEDLCLVGLKILYEDLVSHPFLVDDTFDELFPIITNIQKVNPNSIDIQCTSLKILSLFAKVEVYGYAIVNENGLENVKAILENEELAKNKPGFNNIKKLSFALLNNLSQDENNAKSIADVLMEYIIKQLYDENLDETSPVLKLLEKETKNNYCFQPFVQYKGIEAIVEVLKREETMPELMVKLFDLLVAACNAGDEYKVLMQNMKVNDLISSIIKKRGAFDKELEKKGQFLIFLINSNQITFEDEDTDDKVPDVQIKNPITPMVKNFLTSGRQVAIVSKDGSSKQKHLSMSLDFNKISAKKINDPLPPKPKYIINTAEIKKIVRGFSGHDTEIGNNQFKKEHSFFRKVGGFFTAKPNPKCCFSIIGPINIGELEPVSFDVICRSERECAMWVDYLEIIVNYFIKNKRIQNKVEIRKKVFDDE